MLDIFVDITIKKLIMPITWNRAFPCDERVRELVDKQIDREFCEFQFLNNLEENLEIVYLKISHVFEGRDAFVYEACNLQNQDSFIVQKYAVGIDSVIDGVDAAYNKGLIVTTEEKQKKDSKEVKDRENVYDRLYIHFVVKDKDGNFKVFHHCYNQFIDKDLLDLIYVDGKVNRKFINLTVIRVLFDPDHDNVTKGDLRLRISVTTPVGQLITVCPAKLRTV